MSVFQEVTTEVWDATTGQSGRGGIFMQNAWEQAISRTLPFVEYCHYRYRDTHLVRIALVNGRYTTAPFSEGSDVVSLTGEALDLTQFGDDVHTQFGEAVRLRINERFTPIANDDSSTVVAYEYVVDLDTELLPRVRKTLRHVLQQPLQGEITIKHTEEGIEAAYMLYLRHMRSVTNFALPKALFISLLRDHGGELWTYSHAQTTDAMAIFIRTGAEVLYSLSAANNMALKAHAPHHLVYAALEHYRAEGARYASLGATGKGSALEVFKRGWRGQQYSIYELGARSMNVGPSSKIRGLVKYVPLPLYPLVSKQVSKFLL